MISSSHECECEAAVDTAPDFLLSLNKAERRQVNRHKYFLSMREGRDVGFEAAARDWLEHHAQTWREERQREMLARQREEIAQYKWIRSEEAQRDLGTMAALEWINKYAAQWREWYNREVEGLDEDEDETDNP